MPRPRLVKEYDIRVTPPMGQDLNFITDEFELFIACKEFGYINKKKHYHIYCKTTLNDSEIKKYLRLICDVKDSEDVGNQLYRVKPKHEGTIGYVIKEFNVVASRGYTEDQLSEFKRLSAEYRKQKETERKQKYRKEVKSQKDIVAAVVASLEGVAADAALVTSKILSQYRDSGELMPTRSAFERILNTVIATKYGFDNYALEMYYLPRVYLDEGRDGTGSWFKTPIKFS